MSRPSLPSSPGRRRLISTTKSEYHRLHREMRKQLAVIPDEELRNINVAQNVLRDVLSALLIEMLPYTHLSVVELSKRLASYALSTAPLEDQEAVVAAHLADFAGFHMLRTAQGAIIQSAWRMDDGREQSNFPEGRSA